MMYILILLIETCILGAITGGLSYFTFGSFSLNAEKLIQFIVSWWKFLSLKYLLILSVAFLLTVLSLVISINLMIFVSKNKKNRNLHSHGTSKWASFKAMQKLGFLVTRKNLVNSTRILLSQTEDAVLAEPQADVWKYKKKGKAIVSYDFSTNPFHLLLVSSSRGGKGVGTITSTLLTWSESAIIFDPKGENYQNTAGYRSTFSDVYRIDPGAPEFSHFNPLDFVRNDANLMNDVINLAYIILPENPNDNQPFFDNNGRDIIALLILYVLFFEKRKTLAGAYTLLTKNADDYNKAFTRIAEKFEASESDDVLIQKASEKAASDARRFAAMADATLSSCVSSALTPLSLFTRPTIDLMTSDSHFSIKDLVDGNRPKTVYLTVSPTDIKATAPVTRIIFSMINRQLMAKQEKHKYRLLFLIDEFSQLGRFKEIEESIPIAAGYGICYLLAIQSLAQLNAIYGKDSGKIILDNCIVELLKVLDPESTKYFSDMLGKTTLLVKRTSFSGNVSKTMATNSTTSTSETGRQLMTPAEIASKSGDTVILIIPGRDPYKAKRILFFEEPMFKERTGMDIKEIEHVAISSPWTSLDSNPIPDTTPSEPTGIPLYDNLHTSSLEPEEALPDASSDDSSTGNAQIITESEEVPML